MTSASTLKAVRLIHLYSGILFAPTILFFAITGGLQMFSYHETTRGSTYVPPQILVHLAQLHKKGTLYVTPKRPAPVAAPKADAPTAETVKPGPAPAPPKHNALPTKVFFAATAIALALSTLTGIVMAWKYARRKSVVAVTLLAGILIPVVLLLL
ncbi:hypothetical protein Terro_4244 [Terriglobus roseus DSM 18391]|uniref:PepSY-associated TM region n=1 Tax=Terriglobus roseus (strain DSM 18391 / NRRL B-41598 / KBS 63) TaxID=926566 RepID=I3ZMI0_TERRK|nr:hypothetical protein [Terriglobus roseus]AFL90448.1 hypothetical protein Terro_4244 [Terriglobus roseus DSM 18391]